MPTPNKAPAHGRRLLRHRKKRPVLPTPVSALERVFLESPPLASRFMSWLASSTRARFHFQGYAQPPMRCFIQLGMGSTSPRTTDIESFGRQFSIVRIDCARAPTPLPEPISLPPFSLPPSPTPSIELDERPARSWASFGARISASRGCLAQSPPTTTPEPPPQIDHGP